MAGTLIVDDEDDIRLLIRLTIEQATEPLEIVGEADSGEQAVECWRATRPDVILLDYRLPGMSGLDAAEMILAEQPDQSIVLFSAFLDDGALGRASALGIRAILDKRDLGDVPETLLRCSPA